MDYATVFFVLFVNIVYAVSILFFVFESKKRGIKIKNYLVKNKAITAEKALKINNELEEAALVGYTTKWGALKKTSDEKYWYDLDTEKSIKKAMTVFLIVTSVFMVLATIVFCLVLAVIFGIFSLDLLRF